MDKHGEWKAGNMGSASSCFLRESAARHGILEREEESTLSGVLGTAWRRKMFSAHRTAMSSWYTPSHPNIPLFM